MLRAYDTSSLRHNVCAYHNVWLFDFSIETIVHHVLRAACSFFRWLKHQDQLPAPGISALDQSFRGRKQRRDMHIMTTGMHHRLLNII
jgi:hypothetical protein